MHGPYDDPYLFPSLNGGKPDDYDKYWKKAKAEEQARKEGEERKLYERLKEKYEV